MLYLILLHEAAGGSAQRPAARPAHLDRLEALRSEGRLVLAGPLPAVDSEDPGAAGFLGSAIIAAFADLDAARAWAAADPYCSAGVTARVEVFPFRQVLP
ncbi:YciI family protein [Pseudoxanthomonas sp.]|uniref:YciI family protein n=1 Tax=Pseudoxanthomonas sp. TaxID=1871049 RepID=UPI0025E8E10C|nr:YciI family protein [Pseudoxanthomonas sp.]